MVEKPDVYPYSIILEEISETHRAAIGQSHKSGSVLFTFLMSIVPILFSQCNSYDF